MEVHMGYVVIPHANSHNTNSRKIPGYHNQKYQCKISSDNSFYIDPALLAMTYCKNSSTQETPEMVVQALLPGPSIHAMVGTVTYQIPVDMNMTDATDAQVLLRP